MQQWMEEKKQITRIMVYNLLAYADQLKTRHAIIDAKLTVTDSLNNFQLIVMNLLPIQNDISFSLKSLTRNVVWMIS